ncbi:hypothetical protein M407DRAFT_27624 [Tulasnella calospora MUT 4182]|uniref:Ubiquitin 3 binding protein But2 C-terminal domain-containing protein n=1 Tax=Tulasnella calospora MUT 4182 TaxID=1051891 RepID=A0A0C3KNI5_9AGAM|nr:hypothetical protein M407DRAFT_27624 [Tulasnella calospora MUT 4182]
MVRWNALTLGLLSLAASALKAAPMADASKRGGVVCFVIIPGPPITAITPGTAVTGLQLALSSSSTEAATLATSGFATAISYKNGGIGEFEGCHYYWLNIGISPFSYKPLSFGYDDQQTFNWSAGSGQIVTALKTSTYAQTSTFLACKSESGAWALFLQTGKDVPAGLTCVETQLQVGTMPTVA